MINKIVKSIAQTLEETFGKDYTLYTDFVEQGFHTPCFCIQMINSTNNKQLEKRYQRSYLFDILYFPQAEQSTSELNEVSEKLYQCMECIQLESGGIWGSGMNHHIEEGVLHFFVNYNPRVMVISLDEEKHEKMEILERKVEI